MRSLSGLRSPHAEAERHALMALARSTGAQGGRIDPHRAIATIDLSRADVVLAVLLSLGTLALYLVSLGAVGRLWTAAFSWLAGPLGLGDVGQREARLGALLRVSVPYFTAAAPLPTRETWWIALVVTVLVVALSFAFRKAFLPLGYALRFCAAIQVTALVFFGLVPDRFPYDLPNYVSGMMLVGASVVGIVPIILGLTFYVIDVEWWQKVGLTVVVMGHLLVLVPLQYALQAVVLRHASLIMLPVSFIIFGMLPEVMVLISLYGWGMSWRARRARGRRQ